MTELGRRLARPLAAAPRIGRFERLPKWLNLVPMVAQWCWLGIGYRSLTLPSALNPGITAGGLVGEGKSEYFRAMGPLAKAATAPYISCKKFAECDVQGLAAGLRDAGLAYPVVAKPEIGWCGFGVRRIDDDAGLADYLDRFPEGEDFILQRYLDEPGEAGLFYTREPGQSHGELFAILLRAFPSVVGNGVDDIGTLAWRDIRARRGMHDSHHASSFDPRYIPAKGEQVRVATVASTRVGGGYEDGARLRTAALAEKVDEIARDMGDFHVGRFDVRYATPAALAAGEFTIMEVNGAGSEAVHAWDPRYGISDVYRIVFAKQRMLFRLAAMARARGNAPVSGWRLASLFLRQRRLLRTYPPSN
ncbi:hypothetical protein [Pinirhizobacter soli]|uniref:hypothetical protein n=1 Tax=Pinirhizobacter soli TaxID=2786953 RepID=UPI00202A0D22|nr:hypothetical protein [Pinirhizobacter soli]